ncbi:ATP-dependent Clp protease proteolytic subunit 3, chloroplastic [Dorcoceras hygrometricum]|uniref:ATP-dependent Clp protease proteolytic subunit 3, chloroplastic n=1 Tax=Dorcoceras hygrometricum TaxID=472368 RepID=A0A2Z7CDZ0_9LAMI|nr:ATP-dependent Clp protease proteolytic subunit 3, chloroplastic [Dorcoceras hygrometricum]
MKRRHAEESEDGLALMTSSMTSSQSADGLSPAIARYQQRFALALRIQQMLFALITSRKIQSRATVDPVARFIQSTRYDGSSLELRYYASSRKDPIKADVAKHCNQEQSIQSTKISAEDEFSRSDKPAANQLTIYEELSKLDVNC